MTQGRAVPLDGLFVGWPAEQQKHGISAEIPNVCTCNGPVGFHIRSKTQLLSGKQKMGLRTFLQVYYAVRNGAFPRHLYCPLMSDLLDVA